MRPCQLVPDSLLRVRPLTTSRPRQAWWSLRLRALHLPRLALQRTVSLQVVTSVSTRKQLIALPGDAFYVVKMNDTCASIVKSFGNFTLTQFYTWNPAIGTDCKHLDVGKEFTRYSSPWLRSRTDTLIEDAVCIGVPGASTPTSSGATSTATGTTPSPLMPSTVAYCTKYYYVADGDTCESIEAAYDITKAQVRAQKQTATVSFIKLTRH